MRSSRNRFVTSKAWQEELAMAPVERSKFGLNDLLAGTCGRITEKALRTLAPTIKTFLREPD